MSTATVYFRDCSCAEVWQTFQHNFKTTFNVFTRVSWDTCRGLHLSESYLTYMGGPWANEQPE